MNGKGLYGMLPFDDILKDWRTNGYSHGWFIVEGGIIHIWSTKDSIFVPKGISKHIDWAWYLINGRKPYIYEISVPRNPIKVYAQVQLIHGDPRPTAAEIAQAWMSFKPTVPLAYVVAARRAARNR